LGKVGIGKLQDLGLFSWGGFEANIVIVRRESCYVWEQVTVRRHPDFRRLLELVCLEQGTILLLQPGESALELMHLLHQILLLHQLRFDPPLRLDLDQLLLPSQLVDFLDKVSHIRLLLGVRKRIFLDVLVPFRAIDIDPRRIAERIDVFDFQLVLFLLLSYFLFLILFCVEIMLRFLFQKLVHLSQLLFVLRLSQQQLAYVLYQLIDDRLHFLVL
jgi:hypothetical protein